MAQALRRRRIAGLRDQPRSGKPPVYGTAFRDRVLATLEQSPPSGQGQWDGPAVANKLGASVHAVWRVLRREGIYLQRMRTWCVSTDQEFAAKAAEVVGLYLNPPLNALVISVDEKPSIQAIQRPSGYVQTESGAVVRAMKSTYKRNGTLNLFAALQIASGQVFVQTTEQKKREDFRRFMNAVVAELPADKEIHVILDNYCTHKRNQDWLAKYEGRVQFHFTPTSASWLVKSDRNLVRAPDPKSSPRRQFCKQRATPLSYRSLRCQIQPTSKTVQMAQARGQRLSTSQYDH